MGAESRKGEQIVSRLSANQQQIWFDMAFSVP